MHPLSFSCHVSVTLKEPWKSIFGRLSSLLNTIPPFVVQTTDEDPRSQVFICSSLSLTIWVCDVYVRFSQLYVQLRLRQPELRDRRRRVLFGSMRELRRLHRGRGLVRMHLRGRMDGRHLRPGHGRGLRHLRRHRLKLQRPVLQYRARLQRQAGLPEGREQRLRARVLPVKRTFVLGGQRQRQRHELRGQRLPLLERQRRRLPGQPGRRRLHGEVAGVRGKRIRPQPEPRR